MSPFVQSLKSQRHFSAAIAAAGRSMERLGSGQRINSAADDAAGLAISASLNADYRIFSQAVRNLNDGTSLLNIAEGALRELSSITDRQMELAEQAANGVYSSRQRQALDQEANALVKEYNRIVQSTRFNGLNLLDGSQRGGVRLQAGHGVEGSLLVNLGKELAYSGDGTFKAPSTIGFNTSSFALTITDLNGDGKQDLASADDYSGITAVYLGNGDGSFRSAQVFSVGATPMGITWGDFNGDGIKDLATADDATISILLGNGDGSFKARSNLSGIMGGFEIAAGDFNGDGKADLIAANSSSNSVAVFLGGGDGSFSTVTTYRVGGNPLSVVLDDVNGDGITDVFSGSLSGELSVLVGNGDGSFKTKITLSSGSSIYRARSGDLNGDGKVDLVATTIDGSIKVFRGNGDGSFAAAVSYATSAFPNGIMVADLNGDAILDIVTGDESDRVNSILLGNGDGTFQARRSYAVGFLGLVRDMRVADLNDDGALDIVNVPGGGNIAILLGNSGGSGVIRNLDLKTQASALQSMNTISQTKERIGRELGMIGAAQSRIQTSARNLFVAKDNYKLAESRIRDADVAEESSNLIRQQILQQSSSNIILQGSQSSEVILSLLR